VQLYAANVAAERPVAQLLGFAKTIVPSQRSVVVRVPLDAGPTLQRDPVTRAWSARSGDWALQVAPHSPSGWTDAVPLR
jgi:beta-glucosidase